jgi:hypothetical protein
LKYFNCFSKKNCHELKNLPQNLIHKYFNKMLK